jgi:hypothetical protein
VAARTAPLLPNGKGDGVVFMIIGVRLGDSLESADAFAVPPELYRGVLRELGPVECQDVSIGFAVTVGGEPEHVARIDRRPATYLCPRRSDFGLNPFGQGPQDLVPSRYPGDRA